MENEKSCEKQIDVRMPGISNNRVFLNRQTFFLSEWVNPKLYIDWCNLMKEKIRIELEMEKEIHDNLTKRIEVMDVNDVQFETDTFSCVIKIRGDLWKV